MITSLIDIRHTCILVLCSALVLSACDGVEPFQRRSVDPASDNFHPLAPDTVLVNVSANRANLTWTDRTDNEDGYLIERSFDDTTSYEVVARLPANTTSHEDEIDGDGFWVHYRISPFVERAGELQGQGSVGMDALYNFDRSAPEVNILSERRFQIQWADPYGTETGFIIERSSFESYRGPDTLSFESIARVPADQATYVNSASFRKGYEYVNRVRAVRDSFLGPYSSNRRVGLSVAPPQEIFLSNAELTDTQVKVRWSELASFAQQEVERFVLEQSQDGGPWTDIAMTPPTVHSHVVTGLDTTSTYAYRVRTLSTDPVASIQTRYSPNPKRQALLQTADNVSDIAFGPSGNIVYLGVGSFPRAKIEAWNWQSGERTLLTETNIDVRKIHALSSRNVILAALSSSRTSNGGIIAYNAQTGEELQRIIDGRQSGFFVNADESMMAYLEFPPLRIIDLDTGDVLHDFDFIIGSAAFHPTEPLLVGSDKDDVVRFFDLQTGDQVSANDEFYRSPRRLQYTETGDRLFGIKGWNLWSLDPMTGEGFGEVGDWIPDHERIRDYALLSGERIAVPWEVFRGERGLDVLSFDGTRVGRIVTHDGDTRRTIASFGSYFATGSMNGRVEVWRMEPRWSEF